MDISRIIKLYREAKGLSQKDMATKIGKSPSTYNEMENNLHKSNLSTLLAICDHLDLEILIIPSGSKITTKQE